MCIVWFISRATGEILSRLQLLGNYVTQTFHPCIIGSLNHSYERERHVQSQVSNVLANKKSQKMIVFHMICEFLQCKDFITYGILILQGSLLYKKINQAIIFILHRFLTQQQSLLFKDIQIGFRLILSNTQFYTNKYNYKSDHWIEFKFYQTILDALFPIELEFVAIIRQESLVIKPKSITYI